MKNWLSYRVRSVLGRALKVEEFAYGSEILRRIAAFLLLGPALNVNYAAGPVELREERAPQSATIAFAD